MIQVILCVAMSALLASGMPADTIASEQITTSTENFNDEESLLISENAQIQPENEPIEELDMTDLIEISEEDVPDAEWVIEIEEPMFPPKEAGEMLQTANSVAFRPLFRYRQKQSSRRGGPAHMRIRRRYYAPRRSYNHPYRYSGY